MSENTPEWLTVSQAASALRVSERTVRRRCEAGKLKAHLESTETGKVWLIDPASCGQAAATGAANAADSYGQDFEHEKTVEDERAADNVAARADGLRPEVRPQENRALERRADRMEGFLAGQMEVAIARAVTEAVRPLHEEIKELRELIERMNKEPEKAQAAPVANEQTPDIEVKAKKTGKKPSRPFWMVLAGYRPRSWFES